MFEALGLNLPTVVVALLVTGATWGSVRTMVREHKSGGCGCGCAGCPNSKKCHSASGEH